MNKHNKYLLNEKFKIMFFHIIACTTPADYILNRMISESVGLFTHPTDIFLLIKNKLINHNAMFINNYCIMIDMLNNIIYKYTNKLEKVIAVKTDKNVYVIVLESIVIRLVKTQYYNYIRGLYYLLSKNECNYLERIYEITEYNNIVYIISEKVESIILDSKFNIDLSINFDRLKYEVNYGLMYLLKNGWSHNDLCLDNIGFSKSTNTYIIFDFEMSKQFEHYNFEKNLLLNNEKLNKSIKFNIEYLR